MHDVIHRNENPDQFCSALKQCLLEGPLRQVIVGNISVTLMRNSVGC